MDTATLLSGLLLGYSYLVSDLWLIWVIGMALLAVPIIWKN